MQFVDIVYRFSEFENFTQFNSSLLTSMFHIAELSDSMGSWPSIPSIVPPLFAFLLLNMQIFEYFRQRIYSYFSDESQP